MGSHLVEKPYKCIICKGGFTRKDKLKQHMRLHTNERPFECKKCNKKFTRNDAMKSHMKIHLVDCIK